MESRHYLLPAGTQAELVCGTHWRYVHILIDGTQIGSINSHSALLRGADFFLPDAGRLSVKLIKQVGTSELHVTLNGRALNKIGLDRANRDVRTAYQAVLAIGGVNLLFFCLALFNGSTAYVRWYDLGFGIAFLMLGWFVREGSGMALTYALVMYVVDTLITLASIVSHQYYVDLLNLSINIVLLFFMLQGYGSLSKAFVHFRLFGRMLRDTPQPPPTLTTYTEPTTLPADLKQAEGLLQRAVRVYVNDHQRERAQEMVKKALQIVPSLADGWYVLAYVVERPDDRLRALQRVLDLDPFHAGAQDALDKIRRGHDFVDKLLN